MRSSIAKAPLLVQILPVWHSNCARRVQPEAQGVDAQTNIGTMVIGTERQKLSRS
jgi:hypothetical protein